MNLLQEYHDDVWKHARKQLKHFLVNGEQEGLHHFRTCVKKIKSFSHLLNFIDKKFKAVHYLKKLDKIFDHAGELRDDFLTEQLAKKYGIDTLQTPANNEILKEHFEKLKKYYRSETPYSSNAKHKNTKHLQKVSITNLELFSEHILNQLKDHISADENQVDIHELRKIIKEYLFINELLEIEKTNDISRTHIRSLSKLQELIGEKHNLEKLQKNIRTLKQTGQMQKSVAKINRDEKEINLKILTALKKIDLK